MYEMLARLLVDEFEVPAEVVRPDATASELGLDSLMMAELAVIVTEQTGVRLTEVELDLDCTLSEVAQKFAEAAGTVVEAADPV